MRHLFFVILFTLILSVAANLQAAPPKVDPRPVTTDPASPAPAERNTSESKKAGITPHTQWLDPDRSEPAGTHYRTFKSQLAHGDVSYLIPCSWPLAHGADLKCQLVPHTSRACQQVEIRFPDRFKADNPDNPRQAAVEAICVSPLGRVWKMPGFFYQDFQRQGDQLVPAGQPEWRVRFTPTE